MEDKRQLSMEDRLLKRALEECMEEQLSFVPPEREIARTHQFSRNFKEQMAQLLQSQVKDSGRKLEKKEFIYGFNKMAACILALLVVGGVSYLGYQLLGPKGSSSQNSSSEATAPDWAPETSTATESASPMEEEDFETDEAAQEDPAETGTGNIPSALFLGSVLEPAPVQKLPTESGEVKTLVNSPRIALDADEIFVTIGNMEDHPITYFAHMDLEVLINGYWYQVPPIKEPSQETLSRTVELDPGMAQDEVITLSDYKLDYDAESYRLVTYFQGMTLCAEFQFEVEDFFKEEE